MKSSKSKDSPSDVFSSLKDNSTAPDVMSTPEELSATALTNLQLTEDIFTLRKTHFVLWRPAKVQPVPQVLIATAKHDYEQGKLVFEEAGEYDLVQSDKFSDVWMLNFSQCNLIEDTIYYYWFKVANSNPYEKNDLILYCTDPFATVVDERFQANNIPVREIGQNQYSPAGVFLYRNGEMTDADPDKKEPAWEENPTSHVMDKLPANNRLVIYELPPIWSLSGVDDTGNISICNGNFRQVTKMIAWADNDTHLDKILGNCVLPMGEKKYMDYLGINALELTPPANSADNSGWQYATSNYFAPDFHLSDREKITDLSPRPATEFVNLVKTCNKVGIRFIYDAVMAFATNSPYRNINYTDFFVEWGSDDPEQGSRDGFGGDLVKYRYKTTCYNPNNGKLEEIYPAREYMIAHLKEWIKNKGITGIRLDSVNNIDCYDFLEDVNKQSRTFFKDEIPGTDDKFLVVGEDLSVPRALLDQKRLDGMWNERFKSILRNVIIEKNIDGDNFEWSVRKMIDCRLLDCGFTNGTQAINYITSHDVGGSFNVRIFDYLKNNHVVGNDIEKRVKLAFACLMTAVGIPMILAGEEFADKQDLFSEETKQRDPVNYQRLADFTWRQFIFHQVVRLTRFRTKSNALATDYTDFIHTDFNDGKRIMAWKRGSGEDIVITVANFSSWASSPNTDYNINNWPLFNGSKTPAGKQWVEISQGRYIPDTWAGRESIFPWEAKVYALVNEGFDFSHL